MENKKITRLRFVMLLFMAFYPMFDMKLFYNNITTLIRCIFFTGCLIYLFCYSSSARKKSIVIIIYFIVVLVYCILHHFNALNFHSLVPGDFDYSWFKELMTIWKMTIPFICLFILYFLDISLQDGLRCVKAWLLIICGSIIISNLLGISYGSYSDQIISDNFFSWFSNADHSYYTLASKGFFMHPNQVSAILIVLIPWTLYDVFKYNKILDYMIFLMLCLTCILLGTKVSGLGILFSLVLFYSLYLIFIFIKKEFILKKAILIFIPCIFMCIICILPYTPMMNRVQEFNEITEVSESSVKKENKSIQNSVKNYESTDINIKKNDKIIYVENNFSLKRIHPDFILKSYPYQYDAEFWIGIMELPMEQRLNFRLIEEAMVKRVVTINDNPFDKWFGLTNSRVQNIFNIERDFVLQYYSFGIIGILLFLSPYFICFFIALLKNIRNFCFRNIMITFSIIVYFGAAITSGNLMNHVSTSVPLIFLMSFIFIDTGDTIKDEGDKLC